MRAGDIVAERFTIEGLTGTGGVGAVYSASDRLTGQRVALKVLLEANQGEAARLADEARALLDLSHPGIVRYVAHGVTREGAPYLAMEWLEGEDLASRLCRQGMTVAETLALALSVADALAVLHRRRMVHRDIKPSNLFLCGKSPERVKLLDFGLVRFGAAPRALTRTGTMMGTPSYMAPEQARGEKTLDARADVFSLGCVLFECLTGQPAFAAPQLLAVLAKILLEDAPPVSSVRRGLPPELDALVASMLAKAPGSRPADGGAVGDRLRVLDEGGAISGVAPSRLSLQREALTHSEQRLVSVVWAAMPDGGPRPFAETVQLAEDAEGDDPVRRALDPLGLTPSRLADGSLVVMVAGSGTATDQVARAAHCALSLRAALPEARLVVATGRGDLSARFAVGEVLERTVALLDEHGEGSGLGVRLDEITAGLLDPRFEVERDARGFVLRGEKRGAASARLLLGRSTPCVGRERELRLLTSILDAGVAESGARAVIVTAPSGMGKSRLRHEWLRQIEGRTARPTLLLGGGDPVRAGSTFGLAGQLVRDAAGIAEGEPLAARRHKLAARVARVVPPASVARVAEFLGELAGVPFPDEDSPRLRLARQDPLAMGDQISGAWEELFVAECRLGPVLIVVDDLHWGDLPSVRLLDQALRCAEELPLVVCAFARPEVDDAFPNLWRDRTVTSMRLGPLAARAGERLIREVLGEAADDVTVARLFEHAAGNTFFLEELIRAVAEGRGEALPGTVLAMVQSRLEAIDADARLLLRAGSVFGATFQRSGALALLGDTERTVHLGDRFAELVRRELLEVSAAGHGSGEVAYTFRHATVREAAYAMLTEGDRALGHRLAGDWLESTGEAEPAVLADHLDRGGEKERAVLWYLRAAQAALEGSDLEAVIARSRRGVACGAQGQLLGELLMLSSEAHFWRGEPAEAARTNAEARAQLPRGGLLWCKAMGGCVMLNVQLGNLGGLLGAVAELRDLEPTPEAAAAYVMASAVVVSFLVNLMVMDVIGVFLERITRVAATLRGRDLVTLGWTRHAELHVRGLVHGEPFAYLTLAEEAGAAFERGGDLRAGLFARTQVAYASMLLGAWDRAAPALEAAHREATRLGVSYVRLRAEAYRADLLIGQGRALEACAEATRALEGFLAGGVLTMGAAARAGLSRALLAAGDAVGAEREARAAAEVLAMIPLYGARSQATLAAALLAQGKVEEALSTAAGALGWLESGPAPTSSEAAIRLVHAEALAAAGQEARAAVAIAAARARLLVRAEKIGDPALRRSFLEAVPENARTLALAEAWRAPS